MAWRYPIGVVAALIAALGLWRAAPATLPVTTVTFGGAQPTGVDLDPASEHILVSAGGDVWTLRADGRQLLRRLRGAGRLLVSPGLGRALVATGNGVLLLDTRSGRALRTFPGTAEPLALTERDDRVVATTVRPPGVVLLDARSGARLPTPRLPVPSSFPGTYEFERFYKTVVIRQHRAVTVIGGNQEHIAYLFLVDTRDGHLLAHYSAYADPDDVSVDGATRRVFLATGRSEAASVVSLDLRTGRVRGVARTDPAVIQMALDAGRNVLLVLQGEQFYLPTPRKVLLLDARSGHLRQALQVGADLPIAMAVDHARGRLWVLSVSRGSLSGQPATGSTAIVDLSRGRVMRTAPVCDDPTNMAVDERRSRVYVTCASRNTNPDSAGRLIVLDARSGAAVDNLSLGPDPRIVALDSRGGRLYVATAAGAVPSADSWRWLPIGVRPLLHLPVPASTRAVLPALQIVDLRHL